MAVPDAYRVLIGLMQQAHPAHYLELRLIHPKGQARQRFISVAAVRERGLPAEIVALDGHENVYYGVVPRVRQGGKASDCAFPISVWADFDNGKPSAVPLAPSIVVGTSPGKFQAQWLLDSPCPDLALVERVNQSIAHGYGADPNACDIARVLRLPGFMNLKYPDLPRSSLLVCRPEVRYSIEMVETAFPMTQTVGRVFPQRNSGDAPSWLVLVYDAVVDYLVTRGARWHRSAGGLLIQCPFHQDEEPSLSIHPERGWKCFAGCGQGRLTLLAHRLGISLLEKAS